ncbi:DUF815 domain-containing protein [Desulfofundulus thermobenzoicus]|uniref:DUF815 domain-containing protein n=1 Tax=Desulfofundulus thermobenzoicus TaxID=29376 RepID=A0A6N7ISN1_9FIRM|nr:ATP-binding protein [Desulfofundulus thermobenzoicus]MQL52563.1 DUF815 domain-containing protein [Desulfofundulus thermobenzoicus]
MNKTPFIDGDALERMILLTSGLILYKQIARDPVVQALQSLLESLVSSGPSAREVCERYHHFCALALECRWPDHLLDLILDSDNSFSRRVGAAGPENVDRRIMALAARDLSILQELSQINAGQLKQVAAGIFSSTGAPYDPLAPENWPGWEEMPGYLEPVPAVDPGNPDAVRENLSGAGTCNGRDAGAARWLALCRRRVKMALLRSRNWGGAVDELARYYHRVGWGVFSRYVAFRWQKSPGGGGVLAGIASPDPVRLEELIGLDREKKVILENTEHFLTGLPANNMILYGDRGTGKSSTVKALLNAFACRGLRLVEMAKADLGDFPLLTRQLANQTQKFIIFVDDLSFDETEPEYRALKPVLEGGLEVRPGNVLIYATSNRRHLVKESFSERQGDEVHARDSMEEKLALADRFGITVTFPAPDQEGYLRIVEGLAEQRGLEIDRDELRKMALHWEMWHNGRSGRTARQFVDYLAARRAGMSRANP